MEKTKLYEQLLAYFKAHPQTTFSVADLVAATNMQAAGQFKFVVQALAQLEHEQKIELDGDDHFKLHVEPKLPHFTGVFHANDRGFGFVEVEDEDQSQDFFISPTQTLNALNNDTVEIEMITPGDEATQKRPEGKVVAILEHSLTQVVGEFGPVTDARVPKGVLGEIKLKDKKMSNVTVWALADGLHPVPGEIVLADIKSYPTAMLPNVVQVVVKKVVGNVNDPGVDILEIVYQHDIPHEFPDDVQEQIKHIPDEVTPEELKGRRDLTDQPAVTIDAIESKDLDDAVSVWQLPNGNYHLGVHIADVSHYVTPDSPLDKEAYKRGTSVYLTDRVIPMLPPKLSNGICSLNPQVKRLAMTCEMEIDHQGHVVKHDIFPSVIQTNERMTYVAINQILESDNQKVKDRYHDLVPMFEQMGELHKILLKIRKRRGAIDFDDTEAKIIVDKDGHPIDIQLRQRGTAERMVESFMLAANETVAAHYNDLHVPFVYRVHEQPAPEKITTFFEFLSALGVPAVGSKNDLKPKMLQNVLKSVAGKPEEVMVQTMLLRSMQQAKYSDEPLGHFGLAARDYTHFTSPIRRYPDLMVHRLIRHYATDGLSEESQATYKDALPEIAAHASQMERRAIDTERDTDALKKAEFMADHVGQVFDAVVSSVTKFGMFVALPNTIEGLVHISRMQDDFYQFLEKQMALVGRKTKRTYRIGQEIKVKLINVNVDLKEVDFTLVNPQDAPKTDLLKDFDFSEIDARMEAAKKRRAGNGKYGKRRDDKRGKFNRNRNRGERDNKRRNSGRNKQSGKGKNNHRPFYRKNK